MKTSGNTILVTGGGSGIGEALAHRFHDRGDTVIVAGRRADALAKACQGRERMHALALDIDSAEGIADFARRLLAAHPDVNVLINNAGIMRLEDIGGARPLTDAEETITTNVLGPIRLIDALIEHLKAQPDAAIVNVTSGLAFVPQTAGAVYSASKAAIHSYTVSLRRALAGKIEVIELAPPGVQTELTPGQEHRDSYMPLDDFADEVMAQFGQQPTPPEILVERVKFLRNAEREGRFDSALEQMNAAVEAARKTER